MLIALLIINLFTLIGQHPAMPVTFTIAWDAGVNVDSYIVQQDTKVLGETTALTYVVKVTSLGVHTFKISGKRGDAVTKPATLIVKLTKDSILIAP